MSFDLPNERILQESKKFVSSLINESRERDNGAVRKILLTSEIKAIPYQIPINPAFFQAAFQEVFKNPRLTFSALLAGDKRLKNDEKLKEKVEKAVSSTILENWKEQIEYAKENSPGRIQDQKYKNSPGKHNKVLAKQWLVNGVLTGLCCGLGLEYICKIEKMKEGGPLPKMKPSKTARFLSKLQIPILIRLMKKEKIKDSSKLVGEEASSALVNSMIWQVKREVGLQGRVTAEHVQLRKIDKHLPEDSDKHYLLVVENPEEQVAANHVIYFNPEKRVIADGADGRIISVPEDADFNLFFTNYLQREYALLFEKFSIVEVEKGSFIKSISLFKRLFLTIKIALMRLTL